jgi:4'-phosphopantetheinyl transferase
VEPDACEVWWADPAAQSEAHLALLDATERGRRENLRNPPDQARFVVAAALLRLVVAANLQVAPVAVEVDRTCDRCGAPHGRPRIPGSDLHVSVSHAGSRVAIALTRLGPVGVDVEQIKDLDPFPLARQVLGPGEAVRDVADFFITWSRKESVVKAVGDGLRAPLPEVLLSPPDQPPRLHGYPGRPDLVAWMCDLTPGDGYVGALTVLTSGRPQVQQRWADQLLDVS